MAIPTPLQSTSPSTIKPALNALQGDPSRASTLLASTIPEDQPAGNDFDIYETYRRTLMDEDVSVSLQAQTETLTTRSVVAYSDFCTLGRYTVVERTRPTI